MSYAYDGMGNRVSQTVNSTVTQYLLDVQPGLAKVIGANQERYIHDMHGVHATRTNANERYWSLPDGLGSIRAETSIAGAIVGAQNYEPYGQPVNTVGSFDSPFAFTGEQRDGNGLQYHRARYMNPNMGGFLSLDPFEGLHSRPMSLNGYSWVEGNPVMHTDASGRCVDNMVLGNLSGRFLLGNGENNLLQLIGGYSGNNPTSGTTFYQTLTPTPTPEEIALSSAVIMYIFFDGIPSTDGRTCSFGEVPATPTMGTIVSGGIYTHDHYSSVIHKTPILFNPVFDTERATNPQQARVNLSSYGCIEFHGKNGSMTMTGDELSFDNSTPDGIVFISGDFESIGRPAEISQNPPSNGDKVSFVYTPDRPRAFVDRDRGAWVNGTWYPANVTRLTHDDLNVGYAQITSDFGMNIPYGFTTSKPSFVTLETTIGAITQPGNSGSGWFNSSGKLIGITLGAIFNQEDRTVDEIFTPIIQ